MWLKADAGVSNGVTTASDGDVVQTWSDQSGNSNDAIQNTPGRKPTYKTNIINGLPVIRFDGTTDSLLVSNIAPESGKRMTIFIVSTPTSGYSGALLSTYPAGGLGVQSVTSSFGGPIYKFYLDAWSLASEYDSSSPNIQTLVRSANTSVDFYRNGIFRETLTGIFNNSLPSNPLGIGAGTDSTSGIYRGDIAEIIIYNRALNSTEIEDINTYLKTKYSITPTLTAGSVTLNSLTDTEVNATVTSAAGTTGTYTNQWYAGLNAGFTPDVSTLLSGKTALTIAYTPPDSSLRFLKVVQTDTQTTPASVTTTEVIPFAVPIPTLPALETSSFSENLVIVGIGDSITAGGGILTNLETMLESNIDGSVTTVNRGLSGSTTTDWLPGTSLLNNTISQANIDQATDVVIMLGTNDSKIGVKTSSGTYQSNITSITTELLSTIPTLQRIWLNEPPYPVPGSYALWDSESVSLVGYYRSALDSVANGSTILRGSTTTLAYSATHTNQYGDGIHPNSTGDTSFATQWAAPMLERFDFLVSHPTPVISSISSSPSTNSVVITWNTDQASDSQVYYGTTSLYGSSTVLDSSLVTSHSVTISGLDPSTTYHFQVRSTTAFSMLGTSSDQTFTTTSNSGSVTYQGYQIQIPALIPIPNPLNIKNEVLTKQPPQLFSSDSRNLKFLDRGVDVIALQRFLVSRGYLLPKHISGFFGTLTKKALIKYQSENKILPANGYFGPITKKSMNNLGKGSISNNVSMEIVLSRDLALGVKGNDVLILQSFLNTYGYPVNIEGKNGSIGKETKVFSSLTKVALKNFQIKQGISPFEGNLDLQTRNKIIEILNS